MHREELNTSYRHLVSLFRYWVKVAKVKQLTRHGLVRFFQLLHLGDML